MFDLAGVLTRGFFVNTKMHEKRGKRLVALVNARSDGHAAVGQRDQAVPVHGDVTVETQAFGSVADARLGYVQFVGDIDGADISVLLPHHKHGFKIIFRGFQYTQKAAPSFLWLRVTYLSEKSKHRKILKKTCK